MKPGGEWMKQQICFANKDHPTSPKLMQIVTISAARACQLNGEWHSRLPNIHPSNVTRNRHYACFAAKYNFDVYAVAIWSSPVNQSFCMDTVLELRRMAIRDEAPKNTATWMLSKMTKQIKKLLPSIKRLISYQDTDVHHGTIYKAGNWIPVSVVEYRPWNKTRLRNNEQSNASKIRWEYSL
jgi:hypothetical protein